MDPATRPRTHVLTERVAAVCRLSPADVDYLLANHRAHLELAPTGRRHTYTVTPLGHVGVIHGPRCRLVIRPKIPLTNLFHLLDPAGPLPVEEDRSEAAVGDVFLNFLAGRLARLMEDRVAAGLHRAYIERAEQGPFLQGRLDLASQVHEVNARKDRIHCRFEEFTADVPCNQVPRSTAELLLRSPLLAEPVRAALLHAVQGFAPVQSVPLQADLFLAAAPDRLNPEYGSLLDLCRLLAESLDPGEAAGVMAVPSFLLNLERVFEDYVTRGVVEALAGGRFGVSVQARRTVNRPAPGLPDLVVQPDMVIDREDRVVYVIDAKWKRLHNSAVLTADLYQVLAYGTVLGARRVMLVYPGRHDRVRRFDLLRAPVRVEVRTLRVVGSREKCRQSLERFARRLRGNG